jgi:GDPmannose 4,6-dehydratase
MWRMLQADEATDYVVATGTAYSVRDFVGFAFEHVGLDWERHVRFDDRYLRPSEVDALIGDASKAAELLGWKPRVLTPELARIMVEADAAALGVAHQPERGHE